MGIGRTWEESLQKALRMVDPSIRGFEPRPGVSLSVSQILSEFTSPTDKRIFAISQALEESSVSGLFMLTHLATLSASFLS